MKQTNFLPTHQLLQPLDFIISDFDNKFKYPIKKAIEPCSITLHFL